MKYEEFIAIVREKAQERLGKAYKVMVEKHMTNNGMLVDALCLNRAEEPPSPSLYLNTYFDLYQESMSLDDIMDEILEVYEWEEARMLSIREEWRDYKNVKKMIGMKLVNTEKNKILLGEIANIHFLDLSVLFFICRKEKEALLTTLITHEYMEMWGVTEKDLWETARKIQQPFFQLRLETSKRYYMRLQECGWEKAILRKSWMRYWIRAAIKGRCMC